MAKVITIVLIVLAIATILLLAVLPNETPLLVDGVINTKIGTYYEKVSPISGKTYVFEGYIFIMNNRKNKNKLESVYVTKEIYDKYSKGDTYTGINFFTIIKFNYIRKKMEEEGYEV